MKQRTFAKAGSDDVSVLVLTCVAERQFWSSRVVGHGPRARSHDRRHARLGHGVDGVGTPQPRPTRFQLLVG
jgi:hypothetical protein